MQPKRIQRKRTKGWKMPPNTVYIGRPTRWGNPFNWKDDYCPRCPDEARNRVVIKFSEWVAGQPLLMEQIRQELRGKDLACWCPEGSPCHGDVLIQLAND